MNNNKELKCPKCGTILDLNLAVLTSTKGVMCKDCYNIFKNNTYKIYQCGQYITQLREGEVGQFISSKLLAILNGFYNHKSYTPEEIYFSIKYVYEILKIPINKNSIEVVFINIRKAVKYIKNNNIDIDVLESLNFFNMEIEKHPPSAFSFKKMTSSLNAKYKEVVKYSGKPVTKVLEADIEYYMVDNIELFEEGMKIIENQFHMKYGVMDILAIDKNNKYCIIELKNDSKCDRLHRQCTDYPKEFREYNIPFRMITIAPDYKKDVFDDIKSFGYVEMYKFDIEYGDIKDPVKKLQFTRV